MSHLRLLIVFVVLTLAAGLSIGTTNLPGAWYAALQKPPFNPPDWIFAPVWTVLYILIGIAGARAWVRHRRGTAMRVWFLQMALNLCWSPVFFTLHAVAAALAVILALLACIGAFIALTWRHDRLSALLFMPYAAWVAFASLLNGSILWLQ